MMLLCMIAEIKENFSSMNGVSDGKHLSRMKLILTLPFLIYVHNLFLLLLSTYC